MIERKASSEDSGYYISAWGNKNIIRNHIAYFEKKVKKELLSKEKNITSSADYPNFAAWIRFNAEFICNSLLWRLFRDKGDWEKISKSYFTPAIEEIRQRIDVESSKSSLKKTRAELKKMHKCVMLVLNLRNSSQHGGLPNLMRKPTGGISVKDIEEMLKPNNYEKTKKNFSYAQDFIELLPVQKINMDYASIG